MDRRRVLALGTLVLARAAKASVNVRAAGAKGDGAAVETVVLQEAIDTCARGGGGQVVFPAGRYVTGTLRLRDETTLVLEEGATLVGSPRLDDYPVMRDGIASYTQNYTERCLLRADGARGIGIRGAGTIDGNGETFAGAYKVRPYTVRFLSCTGVRVEGVTFRNSAMWVQHYLDCEDVAIDGIRVRSRRRSVNNDGIDIDSSRRVRISNCDIDCGDDAIVLKATTAKPCQDVVVSNCVLSTLCNAFKLGTESNGGFDNIVLTNTVIHATRLSGIALEAVDGGALERVSVSNVVMREVGCPIFIRLGDRGRPVSSGDARPGVGRLAGVTIRGVQATATSAVGCSITGLPEHPVQDVLLDDVRLVMPGGVGADAAARAIPEQVGAYPEFGMFGTLPAFGMYMRHARRVGLVRVSLETAKADGRTALVAEDVEGLELERVRGAVELRDVRKALLRDGEGEVRLRGRRTAEVRVVGGGGVTVGEDVRAGAWREGR